MKYWKIGLLCASCVLCKRIVNQDAFLCSYGGTNETTQSLKWFCMYHLIYQIVVCYAIYWYFFHCYVVFGRLMLVLNFNILYSYLFITYTCVVSVGVYKLIPFYKGENTVFDVSPPFLFVSVQHEHATVPQKFQVHYTVLLWWIVGIVCSCNVVFKNFSTVGICSLCHANLPQYTEQLPICTQFFKVNLQINPMDYFSSPFSLLPFRFFWG